MNIGESDIHQGVSLSAHPPTRLGWRLKKFILESKALHSSRRYKQLCIEYIRDCVFGLGGFTSPPVPGGPQQVCRHISGQCSISIYHG